jgi:hypothetical protein
VRPKSSASANSPITICGGSPASPNAGALVDWGIAAPDAYLLLAQVAEARCAQMVNPKYKLYLHDREGSPALPSLMRAEPGARPCHNMLSSLRHPSILGCDDQAI